MIGCAVTANPAHMMVTNRRSRRPRPGRGHTSLNKYSRCSLSAADGDSGGSTVMTSRNVAAAVASTTCPLLFDPQIDRNLKQLTQRRPAARLVSRVVGRSVGYRQNSAGLGRRVSERVEFPGQRPRNRLNGAAPKA